MRGSQKEREEMKKGGRTVTPLLHCNRRSRTQDLLQ